MRRIERLRRAGSLPDYVERKPSRTRTAIHEAGHAAMAIILGAKLHRVTIKAHGKTTGHAVAHARSPPAEVLISLAGGIAEGLRYREQFTVGEGDLDAVLAFVTMHGVKVFAPVVSKLLRLHWYGVVAIADELLARETISGARATEVFAAALAAPAEHMKRKRPAGRRGKARGNS